MTALSVIVPTRDRPGFVRDCLATLGHQNVPDGAFEVLVVDDGSTEPLEALVRDATCGGRPARYVRQQPAGLNAARNHGAQQARGELLAYLDDDTLVSPGWSSAILDGFERFGCDGIAGRIVLELEGPAPPWLTPELRSYLSELDLGDTAGPLPDGRLPYGANCALTRAAYDRVGGFRDGLDRIGRSLQSNGDIELFRRLQGTGGRLTYAPDASVRHRVPLERLTLDWFRRRTFAQGASDAVLDPPPDRIRGVGREVLRAGRTLPILARNLIAGRGAVAAMLWLTYCRGRLGGVRSGVGKGGAG